MDKERRCSAALTGLAQWPRVWRWLALASLVLLPWGLAMPISGCAVATALERAPGADLSEVKAGATRQRVEAALGPPLREWTTRAGVRYCLYQYDAGIEPSRGNAAMALFFDLVSLGLFEAMQQLSPNPIDFRGERKRPLMAVSYDPEGYVLGVFADIGEFTDFPEDGRPAAPTPRATPVR